MTDEGEDCPLCEIGAAVRVVDNLCAEARVEGVDCDDLWKAFQECATGSKDEQTTGQCGVAYLDDIVRRFEEKGRPDLAVAVAEVRSWKAGNAPTP